MVSIKSARPRDFRKQFISVVVPAYEEAENLPALLQELKDVFAPIGLNWEVIFVDDGSKDSTWQVIRSLEEQSPNVKGIRLSRNFGHQYALLAGLSYAHGDAVVTMDADLQHPPALIPTLIDEWRKGFKIVHTVRKDPDDFSFMKRLLSRWYYRFFTYLSGVELEAGSSDFRLLDRKVATQLATFQEEGLFMRGIVRWIGFESISVPYQCRERFRGTSKYSFWKSLRFAWHGVSSFSVIPLRVAVVMGFLTSFLSFAWLLNAIVTRLFTDEAVAGWASTVGILSMLFGILFIFLGVIGEYIGRILEQVRGRPLFLVSESVGAVAEQVAPRAGAPDVPLPAKSISRLPQPRQKRAVE